MQNIVAFFDQSKMSDTRPVAQPRRAPASVETALTNDRPKQSGTIQFIPLQKELQNSRIGLAQSYNAPKRASRAPASVQKTAPVTTNVQVNVFGQQMKAAKKAVKRAPASVAPASESVEAIIRQARKPASLNRELERNSFEQGLNESYKKQMRHSNEVNSLIRDLKNYNMDYNPSF